MLNSVSIEEIDHLLNELEQMSQASSRKKFLDSALERLKFLLRGRGACVLVRAAAEQWVPIAMTGTIDPSAVDGFRAPQAEQAYWSSADCKLLAVPIRRLASGESQWHRGVMMVAFDLAPNPSEIDELVRLCDAFAEVLALRQWSELEQLLDNKWLGFQKSLAILANTSSLQEAAVSVVNDIAALLNADRVSLVRSGTTGGQLLAVSGVVRLERKSAAAVAIRKLGHQAIIRQRPQSQHRAAPASTADRSLGLLENYICVPIIAQGRSSRATATAAVLIEWSEYESFLLGSSTLNYVFSAFAASWLQHQRWLLIPYPLRKLFGFKQTGSIGRWTRRMTRVAIIAACFVSLGWALNMPTPLRIEAQGSLQPTEQRVVFAPLDGVVEIVLVSDGQLVATGEKLVEMRSPMLEIQIQGVQGEIRANGEKRDGLNVAINQLANENPSAYALQSQFSSEIRELETQLQTLEQKQVALLAEQQKLQITSPIDGVVIARQIERFLNSRPVRRGDSLLRVVQLDGPWHLELQVSDQDIGYLKQKVFPDGEAGSGSIPVNAPREFDFVIASNPNHKLSGYATWISETARNPQGTEVLVDVLAEVDEAAVSSGHMSATVYAYFDCGRQPFWFVWSRPLIEAIQRKLWF